MGKSFTLIELLIVLVIIGILSTLVIPGYKNFVDRTILAEAKRCVRALADSTWLYYVESGQWPLRWVPPPQGTDNPLTPTVDVHPGISKYWDWSIETSTAFVQLPYGNQATARSKSLKTYLGIYGIMIELYPDGKRIYWWKTAEEGGWILAPEGEVWPF